ncbi:hypothetical protein ABZ746_06105 [Streptomyces sp. NPDC020096]
MKRIGSTYCMSYFDVVDYSICTRTAQRPEAVWTAPKPQLPYLYGGYIPSGLRQYDSINP